ncbi:MAG TPA: MarC family protein [Gemmatimonadales bacterium]
MTILSATLLLLLVLDPFGNIPFFLGALNGVAPERHRIVIVRELLIALVALVVFLFAGPLLLDLVQISESSLTVAGGVVLFLIALRMVFPPPRGSTEPTFEGEPFIVPLAIPFVAGPSALAVLLLITTQEPDRRREWLLAVVLAWLICATVLYLSGGLRRLLGDRGLVALERLMGMVLVAAAVQMVMTGVTKFAEGLS